MHRHNAPCGTIPILHILTVFVLLLGVVNAACSNESPLPQSLNIEAISTPSNPAQSPPDEQTQPSEADAPPVELRTFQPGLEKAKKLLGDNFEEFMVREPLGFTTELYHLIITDIGSLFDSLVRLPESLAHKTPLQAFMAALPWLVLALFFALFFLFDRQFTRLVVRWQGYIHYDSMPFITKVARATILLMGRCAAIFCVILLSYFPVQASFSSALWTILLSNSLWILLVYRAIHTTIVTLFSAHFFKLPREHTIRLEAFAVLALRGAAIYFILLHAIDIYAYHPQARAFTVFIMKILLTVAPVYLLFHKKSILALLPQNYSLKIYVYFRRAIVHNFNWLIGITIILLALNAMGFTYASTFILSRAYTIFLVIIVSFIGASKLHEYTDEQQQSLDPSSGRFQLIRSIENLIIAAGIIVLTVVLLRLLLLYDPLIAILQIPFLSIGQVDISLINILNALLIIGATILASKLLKAILNAKVYPALRVDIGVAYATNTLANYLILLIAVFLILSALGVPLSALVVVTASLGIGLGFGLQTIFENLVSGFIILFGRSVKKGDYITVNDLYGQVDAVGARSVVVRTPDNYDMLIPSKDIVSGRIINWTYRDSIIRLHIPVGVSYQSNPRHVEDVLLKAALKHPYVEDIPAPEVWLTSFGNSAINFELLVHFDCRRITAPRLRGQLNFHVWDALKTADIEIPIPQRDLHIRSAKGIDDLKHMKNCGTAVDDDT